MAKASKSNRKIMSQTWQGFLHPRLRVNGRAALTNLPAYLSYLSNAILSYPLISLSISMYLYVSLSVCLCLFLSVAVCRCLSLTLYESIDLIYRRCIDPLIYLTMYPSVQASIHGSICIGGERYKK